MVDQFTAEKRSEIMSRVKSQDTGIELDLRRKLWRKGYRYRTHGKLPGKPDIVFPAKRTVVFVDGCFWHGCPICVPNMPSSNAEYWRKKIERNVARASEVNTALEKEGWEVLRFYGCQIENNIDSVLDQIVRTLEER